jgi:hypothetical protein
MQEHTCRYPWEFGSLHVRHHNLTRSASLNGVGIVDQGVPELSAAGPGEVEVSLLQQEHHQVEVGLHTLPVGVAAPLPHRGAGAQGGRTGGLGGCDGLAVGLVEAGGEQPDNLVLLVQVGQRLLACLEHT